MPVSAKRSTYEFHPLTQHPYAPGHEFASRIEGTKSKVKIFVKAILSLLIQLFGAENALPVNDNIILPAHL